MMRCGLCLVMLMTLGAASVLAQGIFTNGFEVVQPGLSFSVFRDHGDAPCSRNAIAGANRESFLCEWDAYESAASGSLAGQNGSATDALGGVYQIAPWVTQDGYDIQRSTVSLTDVVARVPFQSVVCDGPGEPCDSLCPGGSLTQETRLFNLTGDNVNGTLYLAVRADLRCDGSDRGRSYGIVRLAGLPALLEIIPTFEPSAGAFSWTTPKHPEALADADRFLLYTGALADLPDFMSATPLDCYIPDSGSPSAGEYFSVPDPLPTPSLGQASYLLIGVEHAGQRRFGRQNIAGVLSGREPGQFLGCN